MRYSSSIQGRSPAPVRSTRPSTCSSTEKGSVDHGHRGSFPGNLFYRISSEWLFNLLSFPHDKHSNMQKFFLSPIALIALCLAMQTHIAEAQNSFRVTNTFKIGSPGGWDYIAVGPDKRIYVSHGAQVNILDQQTGDSVGVIPNTTGVHGIAFDGSGKGYTSNGRLNTVTVFDLKTDSLLQQIPTGQNPDAIMYDPWSKKIITCNGRSHDLSVIDPVTAQVVATIPLEGKPETAVSDEAGKIYINIEDKNKIAEVDISAGKVDTSWSIAPGDGPTGLAIDIKTKRLFAGCDKMLIVVDASSGKVVDKLAIADGCDGVAFDNGLKY